jgi:hypothetical protein
MEGCLNVDELNSAGNKVCEWCFLPEGSLAAGDVMLAQKITLETCESQALTVANRIPVSHDEDRSGRRRGNQGRLSAASVVHVGAVVRGAARLGDHFCAAVLEMASDHALAGPRPRGGPP